MPDDLPLRYLPENLYPMASHHKSEIEQHFKLRSEGGTRSLLASLEGVRVVFLCFTNRVGSNYLTDLLSLAGYGVRVAEEDFNSSTAIAVSQRSGIDSYDSYLDHIVKATKRNGTCIWKIGAPQLLWLANRGFVPEFFSSAQYVFLRRKDKIAQAVSLYIANQTGKYVGDASETNLPFDKVLIARQLFQIAVGESHFSYFFALHNVLAYEVWYEDLVAEPRSSILELSERFGCAHEPWLNLDAVDETRSLIKKQSSTTNELLIERMHQSFQLTPLL
jgi:trehalose 2-sulfotransferase